MHSFRAVVMLAAAGIAFYRGAELGVGGGAFAAYALGLAALGVAGWHVSRARLGARNRR